MCKECGCGGELSHESHGHGMDVHVPVLDANDRLAERNRGFLLQKPFGYQCFFFSGVRKDFPVAEDGGDAPRPCAHGVIVGDLATDNDAERLSRADIPVVQITTGTMCHLDARMIAEAMKKMPLDDLDVLIIENVGNLVCPASYDLGEGVRVVLLSVTEGEDKPLKYPPMFHSADVALVTKSDLADAVDFNRDAALAALNKVAHHAHVMEVSSKTGEGMEAWCEEIVERARRAREGTIQHHGHHHH